MPLPTRQNSPTYVAIFTLPRNPPALSCVDHVAQPLEPRTGQRRLAIRHGLGFDVRRLGGPRRGCRRQLNFASLYCLAQRCQLRLLFFGEPRRAWCSIAPARSSHPASAYG